MGVLVTLVTCAIPSMHSCHQKAGFPEDVLRRTVRVALMKHMSLAGVPALDFPADEAEGPGKDQCRRCTKGAEVRPRA